MSSCSSSSSTEENQRIDVDSSLNDIDDEEDEQIKNGFRALGLMGNVAFMGDESFKCPVCGLKLDSQHTFTLHIRSHNPNDHSNTCSLCGKTLSSASSLDRHMLIHSGERPFKCSLCGMAFTTNGNMHRHMRTHGHGSIGYTPRGQKRRAKLLSQALEKAAAAAAAGEPVDMVAITKLKKSMMESTTNSAPSSVPALKKRHKDHLGGQLLSGSYSNMSNPNVSIEAAAAAAVAAAAANNNAINSKSKPSSNNSHQQSHSSNLTPNTHCQKYSKPSHTPMVGGREPQSSNIPLNLAGKNVWPPESLYVPLAKERGRHGRKKKRYSYPVHGAGGGGGADMTKNPFAPEDFLSKPSFNINAPSQCPICAQAVGTKMDLHIHMSALHPNEKLFCLDCGMILETYNTYTQHHCTATAAAVMAALSQNPNANSELLFRSTNTSRMNFSSARTVSFNGLGGLFGAFPPSPSDTGSLLSKAAQSSLKKLSQQPPSSLSSSHPQSLMESLKISPSSLYKTSSSSSASCSKCNKKFANSSELKHHHETYCHECGVDCFTSTNYFNHQFNHNLEKFPDLSKAFDVDKMQALKTAAAVAAAAFPNLLPMNLNTSSSNTSNNLIRDLSKRSSSPQHHRSLKSLDVDSQKLKSMSLTSLNTAMADMKPDLADIQSIISMTKHATLPLPNSGSAHLRSPISPNRASDAGDSTGAHRCSTGGDVTNQPDSPASADSAAAAVASSSMTNSLHTIRQHSTKTDLNEDEPISMCHKKESSGQNVTAIKRERTDSTSSNLNGENGDEQTNGKSSNHGGSSSSSSDSPGFRCDSCRLTFKSSNAYRRHNRGHTAEGGHSHACHLCPYKSLDKSTLIRHLRTHNGERPFQCAICKYAFTTKANCERHVRKRHRNLKSKNEIRSAMQYNRDMAATAAATKLVSEKIFIERDELPTSQDTICKQCGVDFSSNRELRAHLRVPNNPCSQQLKPFVCTICKIGFNTRNNCVRHIIKQHPSTIEVTDEEAAKVAEESMMIETGSSSSLSPSSNGHLSTHSFSGSLSSSDHLSECDSFSTYEEELNDLYPKKSPTKFSTSPNSSFAALCQVAEQVTNGHPGSVKRTHTNQAESDKHEGGGHPLNLSKRLKLDHRPTEDSTDASSGTDGNVLDLSCKSSK